MSQPASMSKITTKRAAELLKPLGPVEITDQTSTVYASLSRSETSEKQFGGILSSVAHI